MQKANCDGAQEARAPQPEVEGMTKNPKLKSTSPDDSAQSEAFIAKARELEADRDDDAATKLMGKLAKMKPGPRGKHTVKKEEDE